MKHPGQAGTTLAVDSRLDRLAAIAGELDDRDLASEATAERQRLLGARFFAACVGQFKRGKSTLINALVGEDVLPVGVIPVTSVVTILSHGQTPSAMVRLASGESRAIALADIGDFVDERRNPQNTREALIVEVGLPSEILRDGLCLVDTPGLGSVHATNTEATRAFVPRIDVALIVVGPDPPISGAELELMRDVSQEVGELAIVLNKADQVSPEHLREVTAFTCNTVASAIDRRVERLFTVSALERLTTGTATRDWDPFESYLRQLSRTGRERLVSHAGDRAVTRLARRAAHELAQRQDALRRPLVELEARVVRLRRALLDLDQSLIELRFRFDAAEADLGRRFEQQRTRFIESTSQLHHNLCAWIDARTASGHSLRRDAFEEASRLATMAIERWFDAVEPEASRLYREATDRFVEVANDCIRRVAAEAAGLDVDELPAEIGFRMRRQFYFTHLMHTTGGTPVTWLIDRFVPKRVRKAHVDRAAAAYLRHLLDTNSHRVENDFKDRARESRRWLEGQIRARLDAALRSAERAVTIAIDKQQMSEAETSAALQRLEELGAEVLALTR
jgi:predicted GTPase